MRLRRDEVLENTTWNLSDLFASQEAWLEAHHALEKRLETFKQYQGRLCESGATLLEALSSLETVYEKLMQLGTYSNLKQSEDGSNPSNQERAMRFGAFASKAQASLAFINSEITSCSEETLEALLAQTPELSKFQRHIMDIFDGKKHQLSKETEQVLASLGEVTESPYRTYSVSKAADMQFDSFQDSTEESHQNSFALFENKYEFSKDPIVRKNAYYSFSKTLDLYKNTYASLYATEVKKQVTLSKLRGYASVTHMLLKPHKITLDMYHNQIDLIYTELAPHMRRLAALKKNQLGLDTLHFFDLKAPLDPSFNPPATYEAIKDIVTNALGILGDEYQNIVKSAFDNRWIDYSDNIGKATGAFCASPYGAHPYILITYQNNMRSAFTLAHELGHAGHFSLAMNAQNIFDMRPSTYFVEAPSTINEMFLAEYLMKQDEQPRMRRWVILQLLETYYHNFVTHLLEAEFQRRVYGLCESGTALTAKVLCETKLAVLRTFWGDEVCIDDYAGLTWMRQPHYYMGLYPYTYSAGLSAATAIAKRIFDKGQPAIDQWLNTLKAGGSLDPDALLKMNEIDMTTPEPIRTAIDYVGELIAQLETLF